jgi:uncharacterized membrane protein YjjP (DUF1212 family)
MALHTGFSSRDAHGPTGWFAVAVPATIAYVVAAAFVCSLSGQDWLGVLVGIALVAATAALARIRAAESLVAYLGGTAVTIIGLYAAIAVAAELWLHRIGG